MVSLLWSLVNGEQDGHFIERVASYLLPRNQKEKPVKRKVVSFALDIGSCVR